MHPIIRRLLAGGGALVLWATAAQAACSGTQYAPSFSINAVTPFIVRDVNSCALLGGASIAISPSGIMTAPLAPGTEGGQFQLVPAANGTATMTLTAPGYGTVNYTVTVNLGTQGGFSQ